MVALVGERVYIEAKLTLINDNNIIISHSHNIYMQPLF